MFRGQVLLKYFGWIYLAQDVLIFDFVLLSRLFVIAVWNECFHISRLYSDAG